MFPTRNDLPENTRHAVIGILNQVLADLSDLYSQTKQAHWNVRGLSFFSLHKLFDALAESIKEFIDPLAERITALGGIAEGTVRQAAANSSLKEFPIAQPEELSYLTALIERYAHAVAAVRKGLESTDELGDADSADLLTGLSRELDKSLWFLEAHTRK